MPSHAQSGLKVSKVYFDPHELLFKEGDPPTGMFFIEDGTVEVFRASGARTVTLAKLGRGDVIGELSLLEGRPHSSSVKATSDVTALKVEPEQLDQALDQSPPLIRMILKRVVRKLHRTNALAFGATRKT